MPIGMIVATLGAKAGASKIASKGLGFIVRSVAGIKDKATNLLAQKRDKAQQKAEEARIKAAQLSALAGGTTYSSKKPESMAEKLTFGESAKKIKQEEANKSNQKSMEKVTEFFKKNWMYILGGVAVLMFLKKKR